MNQEHNQKIHGILLKYRLNRLALWWWVHYETKRIKKEMKADAARYVKSVEKRAAKDLEAEELRTKAHKESDKVDKDMV